MIVSYLPEPEQHPLWNEIKALLQPAADYGNVAVRDDDEFVWIAFEGNTVFAAGTTLIAGEDAQIRLCGGTRHKDWVRQALGAVEQWARDCGCRRLTIRGRKGWQRSLGLGWAASFGDGQFDYEKVL